MICNIKQMTHVKSSIKTHYLTLFWWKTFRWWAIFVSQMIHLIEPKQCINR